MPSARQSPPRRGILLAPTAAADADPNDDVFLDNMVNAGWSQLRRGGG